MDGALKCRGHGGRIGHRACRDRPRAKWLLPVGNVSLRQWVLRPRLLWSGILYVSNYSNYGCPRCSGSGVKVVLNTLAERIVVRPVALDERLVNDGCFAA